MPHFNDYVGKTIIITKEELVRMALELKAGERINFDSINSRNEIYLSYAIEKICWIKETIVLIGGYANRVMACNEKNEDIVKLIEEYLQDNNIGDKVFLELENVN